MANQNSVANTKQPPFVSMPTSAHALCLNATYMHTLSRKLLRRARGTHIAESGLSPTSTVPKHGALQRVNFKTQNPRLRLIAYAWSILHIRCTARALYHLPMCACSAMSSLISRRIVSASNCD